MPIRAEDIVPLSKARARLTQLAEDARRGREKIVTRNGEGYIAVIDARQLDYYHRLEEEHLHLHLLDEAARGLDDVEAGRTSTVDEVARRLGRS